MLKNLHIQNFALIDKLSVEFKPGLNIITGETGAGKSIIIDALGTSIGEKIPVDALRKGASKAIAECVFEIDKLAELTTYLENSEIDHPDNLLILRKELSEGGRNRAFVNDSPTPNANLQEIGDLLVDLHGQHEHQSLLKTRLHIQYLDDFGGYDQILSEVNKNYHKYIKLVEELKQIRERALSFEEKRELYQFQIREIAAVDPYPGEEDELFQEEKILSNSEKLFQLTTELSNTLHENEDSIFDQLSAALGKFDDLVKIDTEFDRLRTDCESAQLTIQEIAKFLQSYSTNVEFNPDRLETIRERLSQFSSLKRKYHRTLDEIVQYKQDIENSLNQIENLDAEVKEKQNEIHQQKQLLTDVCLQLHQKRKHASQELEALVLEQLQKLGMKNAHFEIRFSLMPDVEGPVTIEGQTYKASATGIDFVEFYISANLGEDLKPLSRVASGGEISRIMLALKSSLAESDKIPLLIFDEIDLGISGRIAQAVGRTLKKLSKTHQLICITHLPQIASVADHHYVVEKTTSQNTTQTQIRKLSEDERAIEIAKLLGGQSVSATHVQSARELIAEAQKNDE